MYHDRHDPYGTRIVPREEIDAEFAGGWVWLRFRIKRRLLVIWEGIAHSFRSFN